MGSNPKFAYSEVKDLIPKEVKVNSIDWYEVLSWIPRGSCNNINWCMFRNFYGSDDDDEDDSLSGPVVESEEGFLPAEVSVAPSPPERPATPRPPSPPLPLIPFKTPQTTYVQGFCQVRRIYYAIGGCFQRKRWISSSSTVGRCFQRKRGSTNE